MPPNPDGDFGERLKAHYLDYIRSIRALPDIPPQKQILKADLRWAGLTDEQIAALKQSQNVNHLPVVYEQVLRVIGEADGGIGIATQLENIFGPLRYIKQELMRQINFQRRDGIITPDLPSSAFVFACHAGRHFFFFETEPLQDDPPVYYFEARISTFIRIADNLSKWFLQQSLEPWTHIDAIRKQQPFPTLFSETLPVYRCHENATSVTRLCRPSHAEQSLRLMTLLAKNYVIIIENISRPPIPPLKPLFQHSIFAQYTVTILKA